MDVCFLQDVILLVDLFNDLLHELAYYHYTYLEIDIQSTDTSTIHMIPESHTTTSCRLSECRTDPVSCVCRSTIRSFHEYISTLHSNITIFCHPTLYSLS